MGLNEVYSMVQIIKNSDLGKLNLEDKLIEEKLNLICNFLVSLLVDYKEELEILDSTNVRFCDYYDLGMFHGDAIIQYFKDSYNGKDKEKLTVVFAIYVFLKNAQEVVYNYELCDSPKQLYDFLNYDMYFEDTLEMIDYLRKMRLVEGYSDLPEFLHPSNKYKILFSGLAYDDIRKLEKNVKKAFIKKISSQLSTDDCITLSESIDHVKSAYDFPISRVQFANDYRIAYIRRNNVTVILGVSIKSGKEKDYNRYDAVARRKEEIYQEVQLFIDGLLPENSKHNMSLQLLIDFYKKEMLSPSSENNRHSK